MKLAIKIGDKATVLTGKFAGKQAEVTAIDKRNLRVQLAGLKKQTVKTKKGNKDLHGTFHVTSLKIEQKPAEAAAPAAATPAA